MGRLIDEDAVIRAFQQMDNLIYTYTDFIDAVRDVPSAQPTDRNGQERTGTDLISRQAAIDAIADRIMFDAMVDNPTTASEDIDSYRPIAANILRNVPSVQVAGKLAPRMRGRWIPHPGGKFVGFPYMHYECDQCRDFEPEERNYCPNCGADMRGTE